MDNLLKEEFAQKAALTAQELIRKRELIEKKKTQKVNIEVKDLGTFQFRIPDYLDIEDSNAADDSDAYLIYACCEQPDLKDSDLQKEYDAQMPLDIVNKIFMPGEVSRMAGLLVQKAGYDKECVKIIEKAKN